MRIDPDALYGPGGPLQNMTHAEAAEWLAAYAYSADKGKSLGPFLMGFAIDMFFFGIMITQFIRWASLNHPDRLIVKVCVYLCVIFSCGYSIYIICYQMRNFVYHFGSYAPFAEIRFISFFVFIEANIAITAQLFYADRAYRLLGSQKAIIRNAFVLFTVLALMLESGGVLAACTLANTRVSTIIEAYKIEQAIYVWLGGQLFGDVVITLFTSWALWKSRTGWVTTDKIITRLLKYTVETQLPPTAIVLIYMIHWAIDPQSTMAVCYNFIISKFYITGMLAVLNDRNNMRDAVSSHGATQSNTFQLKATRLNQGTIHVLTETYTEISPPVDHRGVIKQQASDEYDDDKDFKDFKDALSDTKTEAGNSRTRLTRVVE